MYHSITFGEKNTWDDWHLVPTSRPAFQPPTQKLQTVDIPGGDGVIDLSEALTGYPVFNNREGSFEFIVVNDYFALVEEETEWHEVYSGIMDYLHGKTMKAVLEDDPEYYYEGRFSVNQWASERAYSKIVINYSVSPYKLENKVFTRSFAITRSGTVFDISGEELGSAPVCPTFDVSTSGRSGANVTFTDAWTGKSVTETVVEGSSQIPALIFSGKDVKLQLAAVSGSGTVSVKFRKGRF